MRIAVISDVHGNCVALDAVLADVAGDATDQIVCLGDMIQGGAQPAETVARLRDLACPVVAGNSDAWLLSGVATTAGESISPQQHAVREWSLAQLSAADQQFIAEFQPTVELALGDGRQLLGFHGSPASWSDLIFPETDEAEVQRLLGTHLPRLLTGGHTHLQQLRRLGSSFFFNPGSVGFAYARHQPRDAFRADPWAEYAVIDVTAGRTSLTFRRAPFDVAAYINIARTSGMPAADAIAARYEAIR